MSAECVTDDMEVAATNAYLEICPSGVNTRALRAALSAADAVRDGSASVAFAEWLAREMPPGTIISDPLWWAPRIERAIAALRQQQPAAAVPNEAGFDEAIEAFTLSLEELVSARKKDRSLALDYTVLQAIAGAKTKRKALRDLYAKALASNAGVPEGLRDFLSAKMHHLPVEDQHVLSVFLSAAPSPQEAK